MLNNSLSFNYAPAWKRSCAFIIDCIILYLLKIIIFISTFSFLQYTNITKLLLKDIEVFDEAMISGTEIGIACGVWIFFSFIYLTWLPTLKWQGTIGMIALNTEIINIHKRKISFFQSCVRVISAAAIILGSSMLYKTVIGDNILLYLMALIPFISIIFRDDKRGLHDLIADTFLVGW